MKSKHLLYALLALAFLLSACGQKPAATPDALAINSQIETSVALTVAAGDAQTAAAQPVFTATTEPLPTNTPFPTLTPFATITPFVVTPGSGGNGGSGGSGGNGGISGIKYSGEPCGTDARYAGDIIDQKPHDNSPETILKTGDPLDVFYTIKNVGTKTWQPSWSWIVVSEIVNSDVPANKLLSTFPMVSPATLGTTVEKGEFITLGAHLTAPASIEGPKPIFITVQFALVGDGVKFCQPWIRVEVIRPGMTP